MEKAVPVAARERKKRKPRGTFDRTAYQRDFMRRKRARLRAAGKPAR